MKKEQNNSKRPFLPFEKACEYLSVKPATLYSYVHTNKLSCFKVNGRRIYFLIDDLYNFVINENNLVKSVQQIEKEVALHVLKKDKRGGK